LTSIATAVVKIAFIHIAIVARFGFGFVLGFWGVFFGSTEV
jgi:hypothetical protein